ncbi:integrase arm-type DNA-binding domain-containing protein [Sedimentitalea sp.]|uniref:tyrosine-type recombinase/integrase n=1 Tax=Sedimentitalea sp. TaxID=2048915 RepID=UPI00329A1AFC
MARALHKLSARAVKHAKDGMHSDGGGLFLRVKGSGRSWVCRFTWDGRKREMGIGSVDVVTLAQAREKSAEVRQLVGSGIDPIEARKTPDTTPAVAPVLLGAGQTFKTAMTGFLALNEGQWRNPKHRQQWRNTLGSYAKPLMQKHVGEITVDDLEAVLVPIWHSKPETATRLRGRIERVIGYSIAKGWTRGPNPAAWRGCLEHILPAQKATVVHHAAVPVDEAPAAFRLLWDKRNRGMGANALCFAILGAMRSGEVRGLAWDEVKENHILIDADRMKAGRDHRIPITPMMQDYLEAQPRMVGSDLVFPSSRNGPISDMTMSKAMKTSGIKATPHGWRSVFSDWANNQGFRREWIEDALAHTIGSSVERAYRRGDFMDQRRDLMVAWGQFLLGDA